MPSLKETVRQTVSVNTRSRVSRLRVRARMAWPAKGMLPNVLVIGAQRAGTSSIYRYLGSHPDVAASLRKEVEYLSTRMSMGERWYRAHFPLVRRPAVAFEATPDYLLHPLSAERAATLIPEVKAVALLRSPITRAFSQYEHQRRLDKEDLSFVEALEREPSRIAGEFEALVRDVDYPAVELRRHGYIERGRYAPQLRRWFDALGRERVHVIRTEDLWAEPVKTYTGLLDFLGLRHVMPAAFDNFSYVPETGARTNRSLSIEAEAYLRDQLAPEIAAVEELLDRHMNW